ncbi:hypothetical protein FF36_05528 [Frankia torreyi]|uniref:Uncharacterized protein n=1 Tax=Frankia torreyi TaxID=1856 RepID=A0A0D8B9Z0_9ACTN|nr:MULTISPECIES: hypothetical protein [Frankia]KJE20197.1 hypothetical protein FF36_05528 [Frankia torreyi]KQM02453.1 hypothetical protein FF86_10662 [Frankia sp. CpI1-P]
MTVRQRYAGAARWFRVWNRVLAAVVIPVLSGVAVNQILDNGVVSVPWAVGAFGLGTVAYLVERRTAEGSAAPAELATVLDELAAEARREWGRELDEDLLRVRWQRSERNVSDHWDVCRSPPSDRRSP